MVDRRLAARIAAPAAFLLAVTIFVLLVRSGLDDDDATGGTTPTTVATTAPAGTNDAATTTAPTTTAPEPVFVTVESGDTLQAIADEQGTTVERLLELNPDLDPTNLQIGQRVRVR
jgi:LysM repeat protein